MNWPSPRSSSPRWRIRRPRTSGARWERNTKCTFAGAPRPEGRRAMPKHNLDMLLTRISTKRASDVAKVRDAKVHAYRATEAIASVLPRLQAEREALAKAKKYYPQLRALQAKHAPKPGEDVLPPAIQNE